MYTIYLTILRWIKGYSLSIQHLFCEWTLNSPFFAKSIWIHYLLRDLALNSLSYSRNHYLLRRFTMNTQSTLRFYDESTGIHYQFTICFLNELWILDFFTNPISFLRNHYKLTIYFTTSLWIFLGFTIVFVESLWLHCLLLDCTMN